MRAVPSSYAHARWSRAILSARGTEGYEGTNARGPTTRRNEKRFRGEREETPTLERREATTHAIHLYPRETRGVRFLNDRYLNYYLEYFFSNGEDNSFGGGKEGKGVSAERQKREAARGRSKVHRLRPVHP